MAGMPRGEPRSVPDPDGESYDAMLRAHRAQLGLISYSEAKRREESERRRSSEQAAASASSNRYVGSSARLDAQDGMAAALDPSAARSFPVLGALASVIDDAQDHKPFAVAGDLVDGASDIGLAMTGLGIADAFGKGVAWPIGKWTAEAARKQLRRRGAAVAGEEIHHSVALKGISRTAENWRNHPAFLKALPQADHRRLTGKWGDLPKFDRATALWVGSPTWMKTVSAWPLARGLSALARSVGPERPIDHQLPPPAPYGERPLR